MKTVTRLFLVLLLAGCASYEGRGLRPGVSSEAEVRGLMGPPAIELAGDEGGKRLAYPRGPLGTQTFMGRASSDQSGHSGNAASYFSRVKRSSCAAATTRPSETRQAALSW